MRKEWASIISAVSVLGVSAAADRELLNADFEHSDINGRAVDWSYRSDFFKLDVSGGRNGTKGMMFDSKGKNNGSPLQQRVRAYPGMRYRFGCWIRTENLDGKGYCARVCLQWEDKYGRFISGAYRTPHIRGTSKDWVLCEGVSETTPPEAAWMTVRPEVVGPATGKAWFDDVFLRPYDTNPVSGVYTSAYRGEQATGDVTFAAPLNFAAAGVGHDACRHLFVWKGVDGKTTERPASEVTPRRAKLTVPVSAIARGKSEVAFRVVRKSDGKEISRRTCSFTRTPTDHVRRVTFDRMGRTIVDGKPFFPLGMYWSVSKPYHTFQLPPIDATNIVEFARSPFNCTMPYLPPTRHQLDVCGANGIKVIYPLLNDFIRPDWDPSGKDSARRYPPAAVKKIEAFKDHPALLAWYVNDERDLRELENLKGRYRTVAELDPDHPAWIVVYQFDQISDYMPTFDVFGTDAYPIPRYPIARAFEYSKTGYEGAMGIRPMWQVPQAFDWACFRQERTGSGDRMPTRRELVNMTWQNIAGGANGLVYYSYTYLRVSPTTPFEKGWADVCAAASEVKANFDVLLSDGVPPSVASSDKNAVTRAWRLGGKIFVLAVNLTREAVGTTVKLTEPCAVARTRLADGRVTLTGDTLAFELPALGRTLVELDTQSR